MESVGTRLKDARENKNITLREVSQVTNIGIKFLKALENDEYENFPNDVYLRSFLKTYANFLDMDGERLVGELKLSPASPAKNFPLPERHIREHARKAWTIVLVMVSIWLLWAIYQTVVVKF